MPTSLPWVRGSPPCPLLLWGMCLLWLCVTPPLLPTPPEPPCHRGSPVGPQAQGPSALCPPGHPRWVPAVSPVPRGCCTLGAGQRPWCCGASPGTAKPCSVPIARALPSVTNFGASSVLLFKLTPSLFQKTPVPWLLLNPADGRLPL